MTKDEMRKKIEEGRKVFMQAIQGLSNEQMQQPGVTGEWSVKDILAHISHWEAELVKLMWEIQQGEKPTTAHFGNISVDDLNAEWFQQTSSRPLDLVLGDFQGVHKQILRRLEGFKDQDLSDPLRYTFLKGQPLENWIAGDSYEHEEEHARDISAWKSRKNDVL